jgi:phosphoglycerate dehydrogenase-like enzyme
MSIYMPMPQPLNIWTHSDFRAPLARRFAQDASPHVLVDSIAQADVAFGAPEVADVLSQNRLKWIQLPNAGYTSYDRDDVRAAIRNRRAIMTNSSSVFDEPCAEHVLAMMLAHARQLPAAIASQMTDRGWPIKAIRANSRLLVGQSALILSFGAIARRLVELLAPFRMKLTAVRQNVRGNEPIETHPIGQLNELLPAADHVINILPASPSTERLVGPAQFDAMKPGAVFYNIGRGTTVDQDALLRALQTGKLAAALLDVTDPEPLPPDHPLWTTPNCFITPHSAGGHANEAERLLNHFLENLKRFERAEPLKDRIV